MQFLNQTCLVKDTQIVKYCKSKLAKDVVKWCNLGYVISWEQLEGKMEDYPKCELHGSVYTEVKEAFEKAIEKVKEVILKW